MTKTGEFLFVILVHFIICKANLEIAQSSHLPNGPSYAVMNWRKNAFSTNNNACQNERQPVVEYFFVGEKQYLFFSEPVTWEEARLLCLNYDAKLAILNDIEKATSIVQAIAESDITAAEDTWLGARRIENVWTWIGSEESAWRKNIIENQPGVDNYPPWIRNPTRPTKECLAIDRKAHSFPNFIDLDCRLLRPFLCEKKPEDSLKSPVPAKWVQIHKSTFTLYHGKITWDEAASFCRKQGARLAILQNLHMTEILTNSMTKTRPDFETVWIGAHFSYGQWVWMASGAILNSISENGFPPWSSGRSQKKEGCLLLDRHLGGNINFLETKCDRKRDFVCEEYPQIEQEVWLNDPMKFSHINDTYIIYATEKTWQESYSFCKERGSVLAFMEDMNTTNVIVEAMGDHPKGMVHIWTGGIFNLNTTQWEWVHNNEIIPLERDYLGFPPWADIEGEFDFYNEASMCLNLDRTDHIKAHLYGLDCSNKQPFVCKITCNAPPEVGNGKWSCQLEKSGNRCQMACDSGFIMKGLKTATCSKFGGWTSSNDWLEFPECLNPSEYADQFVKSLGHEMQKIIGYYFLLDHSNEKMKQLSLKFAEQFLNIFPISRQLKMGMASNITNPSAQLHFNQTDNCKVLQFIRDLENKISPNRTRRNKVSSNWFKEISKYTGQKTLIVAIIDGNQAKIYKEIIQQLISAGHRVTVIGLREDEEALLSLASVGFDQKLNLFLFEPQQVEDFIKEMHKKKLTTDNNCPQKLKMEGASSLKPEISKINDPDISNLHVTTETVITTSIKEVEKELEAEKKMYDEKELEVEKKLDTEKEVEAEKKIPVDEELPTEKELADKEASPVEASTIFVTPEKSLPQNPSTLDASENTSELENIPLNENENPVLATTENNLSNPPETNTESNKNNFGFNFPD